MSQTQSGQFSFNGKTLNVFCVVLGTGTLSEAILAVAKSAFEKLAPFLKHETQVLYIRDIEELAIDGTYVAGHCYNSFEAMIALPSWDVDIEQITAAIHHGLHHLARWQNPGNGKTLGGVLLSEGIASYYAELMSGWLPPWAQATFSQQNIADALAHWDDANFNHSEWFIDGPTGHSNGYGLGYNIAKLLFKDGFDVQKSIMIEASEAFMYAKQLSGAN